MKVVIVGGGFAGVKTALNLAREPKMEVTLISDREVFEYHAALYRSATGHSPREVALPLRMIFKDHPQIKLIIDRIEQLDLPAKTVRSAASSHAYDVLILAPGSITDYFGIKGLKELSYGIKSIDEAMRFKNHLHELMTAPNAPDHNYVVVGAGPTGVELTGELVSYLKQIEKSHQSVSSFKVVLVEAAPRILPSMPAPVAAKVTKRLRQLGVKIYLSTPVKGESATELQLPEGSIETHTVVWTAGMTNNPLLTTEPSFVLEKGKKVKVDDYLSPTPDIYVLGDGAETTYSGMAQTALYDADFVACNLRRQLQGQDRRQYQPHKPMYVVPAGHHWAAALLGGFKFYGLLGWYVRRLADLKLFWTLLPHKQAISVWLAGNQVEETCPICAKR